MQGTISPSEMAQLFEFFPFGMLLLGKNNKIRAYNRWLGDYFDLGQDIDPLGKEVDFIWPEGPLGDISVGETMLAGKDDASLLISCHLPAQLSEYRVIMLQDLSSLQAIEGELIRLKRLKKNLEIILNSIDEGVHVVDERGETIFLNQQAALCDGLKREEVLGKNLLEVYPSLTEDTSTLIRTVLSGEPVSHHQQTYINYQGKKITTVNKTVPIELNGQSIGALEISRDITNIRELAEKVIDLQQELKEKQHGGQEKKREQEGSAIGTRYSFDDIIGNSPQLRGAISKARKVAHSSSPVLLYGETGTGKELFAQSIHRASSRSQRPFIGQNCAAMPRELLEGILFGTEKGGFTGAVNRPGIFEQAEGGTLLLDEINAMDPQLQLKLLRVVQEKMVRRVGGQEEFSVDVRLIATTNTHPRQAMEEGNLRRDLYYRLGVAQIHIPPLRERIGDIPILLKYFLQRYSQELNKEVQGVSSEIMDFFRNYSWPGNVRELEHVIEGALNFAETGDLITTSDLPLHLQEDLPQASEREGEVWRGELSEIMDQIERGLISRALEMEDGVVARAAGRLGIKRQTLQYKMKKYGL